jgi:iron complex outermembrane receptor protein
MRKSLLITILVLGGLSYTFGQAKTGSLSGVITTTDGKPAANVSVVLKNTSRGAISASDGTFAIKKIPAGNYSAEISLVGFTTQTRDVSIEAGKASTINFTLSLSAAELLEVTVRAEKSRYLVQDPSPSLRLRTPLQNIPQNVQVITQNVLADQQVFDMSEAVTRNVSGATMGANEAWGNYANINMRGGRITAFRNGMNVTLPWGPLLEDMSMVDRIEFVKGPSGFMLAAGEPTGFYNIVTKKPTGITKGEADFTLGSFDTYRATLDLDGKLSDDGKLLYRFNMMGQMKNTQRQFEFNNRYAINPVITYRFNDKTSLTAEYAFQHMKMSPLGSAYLFSYKMGELPRDFSMLESNLEPSTINDHSLFLTLNHELNDNWTLTTKLAYLNNSQTAASIWVAYPEGLQPNGDLVRSFSNWDAVGEARIGQVYLTGKAYTGKVSHNILGGVDVANKNYYADFYQTHSFKGYDIYGDEVDFNIYHPIHGFILPENLPPFDRTTPLVKRAGGKMGESSNSFYVQDEVGFLNDRLRVTLAGRITNLKQFTYLVYSTDHKVTPRVGVSYAIDRAASVYALYDKSFVAQQGADDDGKPFVPVEGTNLEAGVKKSWSGGRWNSTLSVYEITRNNMITYLPGAQPKPVQTGQSKTRGVELDVRGEINRSFSLIANYAYTHGKVTKDEDPTVVGEPIPGPGFPEHITNAWLTYRVPDGKFSGVGASLGYQYFGSRQFDMQDYFRMDGSVFWQKNQVRIALNANNIFNKYLFTGAPFQFDYNNTASEYYYQVEPGINFRLGVAYSF